MIIQTKTIDELQEYTEMWVIGELTHLYIAGTPGSAKTHTLKQATRDITKAVWLGNSSPLQFYKQLYRLREAELIILDDIEGLLYNKEGMRLLKECLGSDGERIIHWHSNRTGRGQDTPSEFTLKARFCIITNDFGTRNQHIRAIQSRAVTLEHAPKAEETIQYATKQQLITQGMAEQINKAFPMPQYLNIRNLKYYNALRKAGKDWYTIFKENIKLH